MRWILLFMSALALARAGQAQEPSAQPPAVTGYWLKSLSEALGACEQGSVAWGWSYRRGEDNVLFQIDSEGVRNKIDWRLPEPIQSLWITEDCRFAWSLCRDRDHLFVIDSERDRQPVGLVMGSARLGEVRQVFLAESGRQAWLLLREEPYILLAERGPNGISVRPAPGLPDGLEPGNVERALKGEGLWVAPRNGGNLLLVSRTGLKPYPDLPKIDWAAIGATHRGKVLWMLPRRGKGIYAVADDGRVLHGGAPLLGDEEVMSLRGRYDYDYAWVYTKSGYVFAFQSEESASGDLTIVPLNDGKPVAGHDGPLRVDLIVSTKDSHAWVMEPRRFEAYNLWKKVWHLRALPSRAIQARQVDEKQYDEKAIQTIYGSALRPDKAWVKTHDMSVYEISGAPGTQVHKVLDLATAGLVVNGILATDKPGRLWIEAIPHGALMGPATDLKEASLVIAGQGLRLGSTPAVLAADLTQGPRVTATLDWPMARAGGRAPAGKVAVRLFENEKEAQVLRAEVHGELVDGEATFRLPALAQEVAARPLDVDLHYNDENGSNMTVRWNRVTFQVPWYRRLASKPWFQGLLILVVPTALLLLSLRRSWAVRSWVPVLVPGAGFIAAKAIPDLMAVSWLELLTLALVLGGVMLVIGLFSPPLFRELAVLQPFQGLAPVALKLPSIRRQVFRSYLDGLKESLRRSRESSLGESYVEVPVRVTGGAPQAVVGNEAHRSLNELCGFLMARDPADRACLFIEAPGGRGKSALLHELLDRCVEAFRQNPLLPLPVIGDLRASSVEEAVRLGLGRHSLSEDLVRGQLRNGDFAVFLDGMSEAQLTPSHLEAFLQGNGGDCTRLCLATRPSTTFRRAMDKADRWLSLEPERLDEKSVQEFVKEYARADAKVRGEDPEQSLKRMQLRLESLLPICMAGDGTFLPLLVRWCMKAPEQKVQSTADLYRAILELLLEKRPEGSDGDLWEAMEDLCGETYWIDRQRTFAARRPTDEQTRTVGELLKVGILSGVGESTKLVPLPKQVRFFHDSVQSYLTARALYRRGDWEVLFQAAGDPDFKASSDLFDGGAELFWMCLQVFEPSWRMRALLERDLRAWADRLRTALSIDDVAAALAEEDAVSLPKNVSPGEYLGLALDQVLRQDSEENRTRRLGRLYGKLALIAWSRLPREGTVHRARVA